MRLRSRLSLLCLGLVPTCAVAQSQPLDRAEILGRLAQGYSPSYLGHLVKTRGVSFSPSADFVDRVKRAGGDGILAERLSTDAPMGNDPSKPDRPFDFLAKCAEWIHLGAAGLAENDCRAAMAENPESAWPILAALRAIAVNPDVDPQETNTLLRRAISLDPNLLSAHRALASSDLSSGEREKEMQAVATLEKSQPFEDSGSGAFSSDIPVGPFPEAGTVTLTAEQQKTVESALQQHPDLAVAHLAAGFAYAYGNDQEKARSAIAEAVGLEPDCLELRLALASFYSSHHDTDSELAQYREAARISPYDNVPRRRLTDALLREKRVEEAIHEWTEFLALSPRDLGASGSLVNVYLQMQNRESAIAELRRSLKASSDAYKNEQEFVQHRFFDLQRLAQLLYDNREFGAAVDQYTLLLRFKPEVAELHNNLGKVFVADHQYPAALQEYREALRFEPSLADAHHNLANCWFVLQKTDEAIAEYRQALELEPDKEETRLMLGAALTAKGELNSAMEQFQQVLTADPQNTFALANWGHVYVLNKDYPSAIVMLRRALSLNPEYPSAESELARIYATADDPHFRDPAQALSLARHAVQTSPEPSATILDTLAEALLLNGQSIEALSTEEQASKRAPGDPQFQSRLVRFRDAAQSAAVMKP